MTSRGSEKFFYALLIFIAVAACVGMILVVSHAQTAELALYELLAFSVSITAVTLAALGAITNIHQTRIMRRVAAEMREAIDELRDIDADNEQIKQAVGHDYEMVKDIAEALAEAGMLDDDDERHRVARHIEHTVRTKRAG